MFSCFFRKGCSALLQQPFLGFYILRLAWVQALNIHALLKLFMQLAQCFDWLFVLVKGVITML